jgi:hypothetical protein
MLMMIDVCTWRTSPVLVWMTKTGLVLEVKIVSRVDKKSRVELQVFLSFSGDLHMSIGLMNCQKGA